MVFMSVFESTLADVGIEIAGLWISNFQMYSILTHLLDFRQVT